MKRSPYAEGYNMSPETCAFCACVQGAGAAAPVIPTTVHNSTSSKSYMTAANNFALAGGIVRSGVGVYTITLKDGLPEVFDIGPNVWGPNGTWATIADYNQTTMVVSVLVWAAGGAAADLAATEFLRLDFEGQLTVLP